MSPSEASEDTPLLMGSVNGKQWTERCMKMRTRRKVCYVVLVVLAFLLIIFGLVLLPIIMAAIYKWVIDNMMVLDPKSLMFEEWVHPNIPMFQSYYIFDLQNPEEFQNGGKPRVVERGPYVYRLSMDRENVTFHDNGTLSFRPVYYYYFDEEKSVGNETDPVTVLNIPLVTTAYFVRNSGSGLQEVVNLLMKMLGEKLILHLTVGELLWGYDDPLFELLKDFIKIPGFEDGKFGFLIGFNNTANDLYNVFTGKKNQTMLNVVDNYQGEPTLPWWWSEEANTIRGTDGTMYHPYINRNEDIYLFHPDLCRSVPYKYQYDTLYKGVPLLKYALAPYTYDNGTDYPPNAGFCSGNHELCGPSGIMRQDPCRFYSPSAISNPHFFQGDPSLYEAVDGLKPNKSLHQHYMEIEPLMGMPYVLKMRLQISMATVPVRRITETKNIRNMIYPVLWFEQSVEADDRIVGYYDTGFVLTAYIAFIIKWLLFSVGVLIFILAVYSFAKRIAYPPGVKKKENNDKVINEDIGNTAVQNA